MIRPTREIHQYSQDELRLLLEILYAVKDIATSNQSARGICRMTQIENGKRGYPLSVTAMLANLFISWPKFSGRTTYPVPATVHNWGPDTQYNFCDNKWSTTSQYGRLRWDLLAHCISTLEHLVVK